MSLDTMFSAGEELLFSNLSLDLEDLFSEELMSFLGQDDLITSEASPMDLCVSDMLAAGVMVPAAPAEPSAGACSSSQCPTYGSMFETSAPLELLLKVERSAGPPTRNLKKQGPVRLVTTQVTSLVAETTPSVPSPSVSLPETILVKPAQPTCSDDDLSDDDSDSDASNNTEEYALTHNGHKKLNKRKAPEVDWRAITDPAERRRQRRLAKNRVTAARSRERKKVQWADLETKLSHLDNDNKKLRAMLQQLAQENSMLRGQLEGMVKGVDDASDRLKGRSNSAEPAALVFISILLLLCCALPGDQAMLLGSAAPLLLLAHTLSSTNSPDQHCSLADTFLRFLATIKALLSRACTKLKSSVHRMLYRRHHFLGRRVLHNTAAWASSSPTSWHQPHQPLLSRIKDEPVDECKFDPTGFLISGLC